MTKHTAHVFVNPMNNPVEGHSGLSSGAYMKPGQLREDGTIYIGYFPKDGKSAAQDWFATAEDVQNQATHLPLSLTFQQAAAHVTALDVHGHHDWQVPSVFVLRNQFYVRAMGEFSGTYTTSRAVPNWYWSSTESAKPPTCVRFVRFSDGGEDWVHKDRHDLCLRPVRGEPRP